MGETGRGLLDYPFALPPARRVWLVRVAPELFALLVWAVFAVVWLGDDSGLRLGLWESLGLTGGRFAIIPSGQHLGASLSRAAVVAADLAGFVLVLAPIAFVAPAFSTERQNGTLEAMLLTSTHHDKIVRGRFRCLALPWLRLVAYLLPIYLLLAAEPLLTLSITGWSHPWMRLTGWLMLLGRVRGEYVWEGAVTAGPGAHTAFLACMRLLHDASAMALSIAVTFHISLRAKNLFRTILWSLIVVPPVVLVACGPELLWMLGAFSLPDVFVHVRMYWITAIAVVLGRYVLASRLLARDARHFDAYVLGQPLVREEPRRRAKVYRRPQSI